MDNNTPGALPKISIITPTLNQAQFIERTILSVLNQNYPNLEYLIFDGGSSDGTQEILKKYSDRIRWWSEPDRGQSNAINKGLNISTGEIIGFINSDDEYEPGALFRVGKFFSNHPQAMWVTGKCKVIDIHGREVLSFISIYKNILLRFHSLSLLGIVNYIAQPATFWRRQIVREIGLFDEGLRYVMDYDYWFRIAQKYPLNVINSYLARFRLYPTSKTWQSALVHDDEEIKVVGRYIKSPLILGLHKLHRFFNNAIYAALKSSIREKKWVAPNHSINVRN